MGSLPMRYICPAQCHSRQVNLCLLVCRMVHVCFQKTGEVAALVSGVNSPDDMLRSKVIAVSKSASNSGIKVGMTGREALEKMRSSSKL